MYAYQFTFLKPKVSYLRYLLDGLFILHFSTWCKLVKPHSWAPRCGKYILSIKIGFKCSILFINFFGINQGMNSCRRYMMNSSFTFHNDVNYSNCVLGYPVLKRSIPFSHQRSRFASLYQSKLKSLIQEMNCLISFI